MLECHNPYCGVTVHCTDSLIKRCILIAPGLNATPSAEYLFYRNAFSPSSEKITGSNPDRSQGHVLWVRRSVHFLSPSNIIRSRVCVSSYMHNRADITSPNCTKLPCGAACALILKNKNNFFKKIRRMSSCVLKPARLRPPLVITVASCCVIGES